MKKLLALIILLGLLAFNISADGIAIKDDAYLLSESEKYQLEEKIESYKKQYQIDFVIYTTNEYYAGDVRYAAADYYDYNGYRSEGVLLYINMANREYFVLTTGDNTIYRITDYAIEKMNDGLGDRLSDGDYFKAMNHYLDSIAYYLDFYNETHSPYDYNNHKTQSEKLNDALLFSGIIAAAVTLIFTVIMVSQLKSIKAQRNASAYSVNGRSFLKADITKSRDMFLYRTVTRVPIPKPNDSSHGGSSTFHGSSGISHGGGGGRF